MLGVGLAQRGRTPAGNLSVEGQCTLLGEKVRTEQIAQQDHRRNCGCCAYQEGRTGAETQRDQRDRDAKRDCRALGKAEDCASGKGLQRSSSTARQRLAAS